MFVTIISGEVWSWPSPKQRRMLKYLRIVSLPRDYLLLSFPAWYKVTLTLGIHSWWTTAKYHSRIFLHLIQLFITIITSKHAARRGKVQLWQQAQLWSSCLRLLPLFKNSGLESNSQNCKYYLLTETHSYQLNETMLGRTCGVRHSSSC